MLIKTSPSLRSMLLVACIHLFIVSSRFTFPQLESPFRAALAGPILHILSCLQMLTDDLLEEALFVSLYLLLYILSLTRLPRGGVMAWCAVDICAL